MRFSSYIKVPEINLGNGRWLKAIGDVYLNVSKDGTGNSFIMEFRKWGIKINSHNFDDIPWLLSEYMKSCWLNVVEENDLFLTDVEKRVKSELLENFEVVDV